MNESRPPSTVEDRLRLALTAWIPETLEGVDMSSRAITERVIELCEMSKLCLELAAIGRSAFPQYE